MEREAKAQTESSPVVQALTLTAVALGSAAVGFLGVVYWFGQRPTENPRPQQAGLVQEAAPDQRTSHTVVEETADPETPVQTAAAAVAAAAATAGAGPARRTPATSPPSSAAAQTAKPSSSGAPDGPWATMGEPFYWRCWARGQKRLDGEGCDRLKPLERLVAGQLGIAVRCQQRHGISWDRGTLNLAVEANFSSPSDKPTEPSSTGLRLWAGKSSSLRGAAEVVACMRQDLGPVSLKGIAHERERYVVFFPVQFGAAQDDRLPGRAAQLQRDRVRLRRAPETGRIQARLRRGELLRVLGRRDDWLRVRTSDGLQGWVYAQAIEDRPSSKP